MNYQMNWKNYRGMTAIPTQALSHLREASGDSLRVLLLLFSETEPLTVEEISTRLSLSEGQIDDSLRYWHEKGILIEEKEEKAPAVSLVKPSASSITSEELTKAYEEDPQARLLFENSEALYGRPLKPLERRNLLYILQSTLLPVDVILMMIDFCVRMDKLTPRYLMTLSEDWADRNITSHELAEKQIQILTEKTERERLITGCFGIHNRRLTKKESDYIEKWFSSYSYSLPIIQIAYEKTVDTIGKLSFAYTNKILTSWHKEGVKTPEDIAKVETLPEKKKKTEPKREASYDLTELSKRGLFIPEE